MKIIVLIFWMSSLFVCCKTLQTDNRLSGEYHDKGKDYEYNLTLRADNSFELQLNYQDARPRCEGNWKIIGNKTINLQCEEVSDVTETLSNGYMNEREHDLEIVSVKKLKFKGVTLIKKE